MKLISMIEFVLDIADKPMENKLTVRGQIIKEYYLIIDYANFLRQPLTLGMFVPCDEKGNVLKEPISREDMVDKHGSDRLSDRGKPSWDLWEQEVNKYQTAKDRVLFEGFEIEWKTSQMSGEQFYGVTLNGQWCGSYGNFIDSYLKGDETIEGLNNLREKLKPTLTKSAIKQLGI